MSKENKFLREASFSDDWNYVQTGERGYHRTYLSNIQFDGKVLIAMREFCDREINSTVEADVRTLKEKWLSLGLIAEAEAIDYDEEGESFYHSLYQDVKKSEQIRLENPKFYVKTSLSVFDCAAIMNEVKMPRRMTEIKNLSVPDWDKIRKIENSPA